MIKPIVAGLLACACFLSACASKGVSTAPVATPPMVTIPDVTAFLPGQSATQPMLSRRHDWGPGEGFQISDGFRSDDGSSWITTWSYPPFGAFVAANGDGGEIYVTDGVTVRIAATEDGSSAGTQGFYGEGCGGTGWVAYRNDAPTGSYASFVAYLTDQPIPSACAASNPALTRYRLETVAIPFQTSGVPSTVTLPTIISEHYDDITIDDSTDMERSFFAQGIGRVIWEAWSTNPPDGADLAIRCPPTAYSVPPAPGWQLSDCRVSTSIWPADGSMTGDLFGWPPKGLTLP